MAPEQAENATDADFRSDLYSLGATLFHLLTGELPLKATRKMDCLTQLLLAPARPLREIIPEAPARLAEVVDRLRNRDPADRPASADEVIARLLPFAGSETLGGPAWHAQRKAALVKEVLKGKMTAEEACERNGVVPEEFERWRQCFLEGAERALEELEDSVADAGGLSDLRVRLEAQAGEIEELKQRLNQLDRSGPRVSIPLRLPAS
jgi:transposase-like protein